MSTLRSIPSIERLRQRSAIRLLEARYGGDATLEALRGAASKMREALSRGVSAQPDEDTAREIERMAAVQLEVAFRPSLQRVINATGVIVHTNLGRAPLSEAAIARVAEVARGYSTLEYDVARGERGRRDVHAESMLCRLDRRASRDRRQQQRRRDDADTRVARGRARSHCLARGARRDRRRLPRPRRHDAVGRRSAGGRHDQQDTRCRLRRGDQRADGSAAAGSIRRIS